LQKITRRTNALCTFSPYIGYVAAIKTAATYAINDIKTSFIARETTLKRRLPISGEQEEAMKNRVGAVILAGVWAAALLATMGCRSPAEAEVRGTVAITEEPEEPAQQYGINITQPENGAIECGTSAAAGVVVTLTLSPRDEDYRYRAGSLAIEPEVELTDMGGGVWTFTMPEEPVSITAEFEEIPVHTVMFAESVENGSLGIMGIETTGPGTGQAREGAAITVTVIPHAGYKLADNGLWVTPAGAVAFTRVDGQPAWTFTMTDTNLEIGVAFAELGPREIYRGGARKGITPGELSDDKKYFADSINMESGAPGRNGNGRSITITHALNANGGGAQQSFGLFSDTEIDLETVAALSFWARANKSLNIRYVGFGDADPDKRVVYTGENYNQQIPVGVEWRRYVIPVPTARGGQRTARVFFFNATIAIDNYVCIDDIEFIETGVAITEITLTGANKGLFYGATDVAKILKGAPLKLTYACDDGAVVTLQNASSGHTLKYNLVPWLLPFIGVDGNVTLGDGVITAREKGTSSAITLSVHIPGAQSGVMNAAVIDGLLLDDFEDIAGTGSIPIPGTPSEGTGYLWHTTSSGSVVVSREYVTTAHNEIYSGLHAGSWRPAATANKPRGGRNFNAKDAAGCNTLTFRIKVTVGGGNTVPRKNTVFTFELRNGGTLTNKTGGSFFAREFTYDSDGWQEVTMPLADFVDVGLDSAAITGYALGVVDNQGTALRIMLDDIALIYDAANETD
jgi:hypothetical protein